MLIARHATLVALPALLVFGLTGCALVTASGSNEAPTAMQACAMGHTWTLDTKDLSSQISADLKTRNLPVTNVETTGTQTLKWGVDGTVTNTADYTIVATVTTAPEAVSTVTQVYKVTATGRAFISSDVAIPRDWQESGKKLTQVGSLNGAVDDPLPFPILATAFDDAVGLELTCDGKTLTTHARGIGTAKLSWTKSD